MPANIIEEPHRLTVVGVLPFTYQEGRDSLVLAANAASASFGRDRSYAALKGESGLAFRLLFHEDWHRFSPDALCGYDHTAHLLSVLGLSGALIPVDTSNSSAVNDSFDVIRRSLADGYPVLGMHLMDYEDWGVIAGITTEGQLLCQTPHNATTDLAENKNLPSMLLRITGEIEPLDDPWLWLTRAMRIAVELHVTSRYGPYYSGRAAYRFWTNSLRDSEAFALLEAPGEQSYESWIKILLEKDKDHFALDSRYSSPYLERAHVNAWRLESLIDARKAAAAYLTQAAQGLTGKTRTRIQKAADYYARLVDVLSGARPDVSWEWNLMTNPWTQEKRMAQADALSAALALENAAIKEIQGFLGRSA